MFNRVTMLLVLAGIGPAVLAEEPPLPEGAIARLGSTQWRNLVQTSVGGQIYFTADGKSVIAPTSNAIRSIDFDTGRVNWEVKDLRGETTFAAMPDGRLLASERGGFRVFEPATGKETQRVASSITAFQFLASDGKQIACWHSKEGTAVLDFATGQKLWQYGERAIPNSPVAFVPGTAELVTRELRNRENWICILDSNTQKSLREWKLPATSRFWVQSALSPDGKLLFTAGDENVHLWTVATGKEHASWAGHGDEVIAGAFTADGKRLVTSSKDKTLRWWDLAAGKELGTIEFGKWAWALAVSPNGQRVAAICGGSNALHRFDLKAGRELPLPDGHADVIEQLAFLPDGTKLISASRDGAVRVWDLKTRQTTRSWRPKKGPPRWLAISPDGKLAAIAAYNESVVRLWDIATGNELRSMPHPGQAVGCIAFTPKGDALLSGGHDFAPEAWPIIVWDVSTGKHLKQIPGHPGGTWGISFVRDGPQFVTQPGELSSYIGNGDQAMAHLRNLETGRAAALAGRWDHAVTVSPDGRSVALARQPSPGKLEVDLVELASGDERLKLAQPLFGGPLVFSPDGRVLATHGPHRVVQGGGSPLPGVYFWDTATGEEIRHFDAGQIWHLAFSPDGKTVATGSVDGTVMLWDVSGVRAKVTVPNITADGLWTDLADEAPKAYLAVVALSAQGDKGVSLLRERLKPAASIDPKRTDQLLTDLESPQFAVRDKANVELTALFERAEPALRARLKTTTSAEARKVISQLLEKLDSGWLNHAERLREVRAIEALERMESPAARRLLEELVKGDPAARLTREAQAALKWKDNHMAPKK